MLLLVMRCMHHLDAVLLHHARDVVLFVEVGRRRLPVEVHADVRAHAAHRIAAIATDGAAERLDAGMRVQMAFRFARIRAAHLAQRTAVLMVMVMVLLLLLMVMVVVVVLVVVVRAVCWMLLVLLLQLRRAFARCWRWLRFYRFCGRSRRCGRVHLKLVPFRTVVHLVGAQVIQRREFDAASRTNHLMVRCRRRMLLGAGYRGGHRREIRRTLAIRVAVLGH